jgi:cytidine deaminase
MEQQQPDEKFMRLALNEAEKALEEQEVPIGAVVVADGRIVGRGHNLVETLADATAHAEMQALTAAASTVGGKYLSECTLYVTVEPCIMCAGAIAWSQLEHGVLHDVQCVVFIVGGIQGLLERAALHFRQEGGHLGWGGHEIALGSAGLLRAAMVSKATPGR